MIPFEINVRRYMNLNDRTCPLAGVVILDMVFEQLDIVFANGRCKQLAEICQGIMKVFRFADLLRIDNPAHPYFVELSRMLLDQAFEIDGIDQSAFAVCIFIDLYRFLDERKRRTRAQSRCIDGALVSLSFFHWTIGKKRELLLIKIPGIVKNEWLVFPLFGTSNFILFINSLFG